MTEQNLERAQGVTGKWFRSALVCGAILAFLGLFWLVRLALVEFAAKAWCGGQGLKCELKASRADFGGVTIRGLKINGKGDGVEAVTAERVAVDLGWAAPWAARADWVGAERLKVRLNLTGKGAVLGPLDAVVKSLTSTKPKTKQPMPRLALRNLELVADTVLGPVTASGEVIAASADRFAIDLAARPQNVGDAARGFDLDAARFRADAAGGALGGKLTFDLKRFIAEGAQLDGVRVDLDFAQPAGGVLTASGKADAKEVALAQGHVRDARAAADLEAAALDLSTLSIDGVLNGLKRLDLKGATGVGGYADASWRTSELNAQLAPRPGGGAGGDVHLTARDIRQKLMSADRLVAEGVVEVKPGEANTPSLLAGEGTARISGAMGTQALSDALTAIIEQPLKAVLPNFSAAAGKTMRRAGESFELVLPWRFRLSEGGWDAAALSGAHVKAASGLQLSLSEPGGQIAAIAMRPRLSWSAGGEARMSGGGGPDLIATLSKAAGDETRIEMAGGVDLRRWPLNGDVLSAQVTNLAFTRQGESGKAAGAVDISYTGGMAGGQWREARASGRVAGDWSGETFKAEAPDGLTLAWSGASYGDTSFGKGVATYVSEGPLATSAGGGLAGRGAIGAIRLDAKGRDFTAEMALGRIGVSWRSKPDWRVEYAMAPSSLTLDQKERRVPISFQKLAGALTLKDGWETRGVLEAGKAQADEASVEKLRFDYRLSGEGDDVGGELTGLTMRVFDPQQPTQRRFEAATFAGGATLKNKAAAFTGRFQLEESGVQIAEVNGAHNLGDGKGSLTFAPTPLIFRPRGFQPSKISNLLRGPANVTGRVDVGGAARWTQSSFEASAMADFQKVGFTLASAGTFEGVSGRVSADDLLHMTSAPGQTVTIDKVTLGLPIEKGVVKFQLVGFDAIKLETASWPFVGGAIQLEPTRFVFGAERNVLTVRAKDWDLARLIELFKLKDLKVTGVVGGAFPVAFSTGSARVEKAVLKASETGGVINFSGSTGEAAGQGDPNAKMVFDALKDFRYKVLNAGLDGDLAGKMVLSLKLEGYNPSVLNGAPFDLNISIDSDLVNLLNTARAGDPTVNAIVGRVTGGPD